MEQAGQSGAHAREPAGAFCPVLEPGSFRKAHGPEEYRMSPGAGGGTGGRFSGSSWDRTEEAVIGQIFLPLCV